MSDLQELYDLAQGLVDSYSDRDILFSEIDRMFRLDWSMPDGMPDWVMKSVTTDPRDIVTTVVRTFATIKPRFKIMPMQANEPNRMRANEIETAIGWNFKKAGRRSDSTVAWDAMFSSAKYAMIGAQIIYLPYQIKVMEAMVDPEKSESKSSKAIRAKIRRAKEAMRFGDFAYIFHNPSNLYPSFSEYGLESNLTCRVQTVDEFRATWGKLANSIVDEQDYQNGKVNYVTTWDYIDYEIRTVWGVFSDTNTRIVAGSGMKILEEENKLGFIPYVIKRWGDSLSDRSDEKVMPLLQSIYKSGQWDVLNAMDSLDASLTIKRAAQPQYAAELPPGQDIELDNTEPVGVARLPVGTQKFTPLPAQSVDQRLSMEKNQYKSGIWQTGVNKVLNTLEFPSGTAYSSVNQLLTQATNSVIACKLLGELALGELAHLMLCWGKYYDKEYGNGETSLYGQYDDKKRSGQEVSLAWNMINPSALDVEVILTPDIPIDKLQTINGAVLMKQNFRVPEEDLLEDLGVMNPMEAAERRDQEDFNNAYIQNDLQKIQMETQLEFEQKQMEMQAGLQQQQMQQQQEAQSQQMQQEQAMRQQEAAGASASQNGSPAQDQMAGMNPAMGGMPPVQVANGQR